MNFASRVEFAAHFTEHQRTHPRDLSRLKCPFCNGIPGAVGFVGHICHHLEELSLSALPQEAQLEEGSEGEVDDKSLIWRSTSDTDNLETHDTNPNVSSPTDNRWDQLLERSSPSTETGLNRPVGLSNTDLLYYGMKRVVQTISSRYITDRKILFDCLKELFPNNFEIKVRSSSSALRL